jgi:hypothetical protein
MATIFSDVAKTIHEEVDRASRAHPKPGVRVEAEARKARVGDDRTSVDDDEADARDRERREGRR